MVAVVAEFLPDGRIARARVAVGACSPVAARLPALEAALAGRHPDPSLVSPDHLSPLTPIDDIRASGSYRLAAALELVRRSIGSIAAPQAVAA
jgi:CO/xanthine dehydrogenase FAD-binding subunit